MHYAILIYESQQDFADRVDPERGAGYWGSYMAYGQALAEAGILVSGTALQGDHSGTTIRLSDGKRQVQDGPYADTKEQLGGIMVIDVPDLDTALEWAAKCPSTTSGATEVRPVADTPSL